MIVTAQLGVMEVLQAARKMNFSFSRCHRQTADLGMSAGQHQRRIRPPRKPGILLKTRSDASRDHPGFVLPPQQRVVHLHRQVAGVKIEREFLVFPQQLTALHFDVCNRKRDEFLHRSLGGMAERTAPWRHGSVGGAIGIGNDVGNRMLQHQRMQSNGGAEERNDFNFRLQAVDSQKWNLVRSFAAMNGQVAGVHAEAERDGVQFAKLDAAARHFLQRRDHSAANHLLKGIGRDVPAEQTESDKTENAKPQKEFPQDAPAHGRNRLGRWFRRRFGRWFGQRFRSPLLDSGVRIWLPERRLTSHPESSSFIFCSASKSLIRPKTSVNGVARLPARFISGSSRSR